MVDHFCANLNEPSDDRVYGRLDALAPKWGIPDLMEQLRFCASPHFLANLERVSLQRIG